jgi:hypothetical protein
MEGFARQDSPEGVASSLDIDAAHCLYLAHIINRPFGQCRSVGVIRSGSFGRGHQVGARKGGPVKHPVAGLAAREMFADDVASRSLGMELLAAGDGTAVVRMRITEQMVNGHAIAHGGYLFTLADTAFGCACNSYGPSTT